MRNYTIALAAKGNRLASSLLLLLFAISLSAGDSSPLSNKRDVGGEAVGEATTILFTGDILLDRGVRRYLQHGGMRRIISDEMGDFLRSADIVVGNLECPTTTILSPAFKRFVFRGDPQWLDSLRYYGFTHLNLANNHSVDQGRDGLRDTRQNILRAGLVPVGADSTMQAAAQHVLLTSGSGRRSIYLLASNRLPLESHAYLPDRESISQEPLDSLLQRIRTLRQADSTAVIIVTLHWGAEHTLSPVPQQRVEAHTMIDAGADVIIGHHTHTLQTIETYKGKSIYYSIGNFIFDQQQPLNTQACVVRLRITNDDVKAETVYINIDHCSPQWK